MYCYFLLFLNSSTPSVCGWKQLNNVRKQNNYESWSVIKVWVYFIFITYMIDRYSRDFQKKDCVVNRRWQQNMGTFFFLLLAGRLLNRVLKTTAHSYKRTEMASLFGNHCTALAKHVDTSKRTTGVVWGDFDRKKHMLLFMTDTSHQLPSTSEQQFYFKPLQRPAQEHSNGTGHKIGTGSFKHPNTGKPLLHGNAWMSSVRNRYSFI